MNENIDLTQILKDCPKGTKLYSPLFGELELMYVQGIEDYPIITSFNNRHPSPSFSSGGTYFEDENGEPMGECMLFPSKDQRDWSKFELPKKVCEFKPFQRVIARNGYTANWKLDLFSHYDEGDSFPYRCVGECYIYCLPYEGNEQLLGTTNNPKE